MDIQLTENGNGGAFTLNINDLSVVYGVENMPYLAMFGGSDWWGNTLLFPNNPSRRFLSETQAVMLSTALNSSGRLAIENAIKRDLSFLLDMFPDATLIVETKIVSDDRLSIFISFNGQEISLLWNPQSRILVDVGTCPIITGLTCTEIETSSLTFEWNTYVGAMGYEYAINTTGDTPTSWTFIASNVVTISDLTGGIEYFFFVRNKCGLDFYSTPVSISATTTPITCSIPSGITVIPIGTNTATVNWVSPNTVGVKIKYVFNTTGIMPSLDFATGTAVESTDLSFTQTGLISGTHYWIWLRTRCSATDYSTWTSKEFDTL